DIYAGQMVLRGQTLYVASGQGDLQLYDISPWLEGRYKTTLTLRHYFSVTGDVTTLAFHPRALYAGSTFPYAGDQPTENPVENANVVNHLGGRLNTIVNDLLVITGHVPSAEGRLPATAAIEIQFNRLLDAQQLAAHRDDLLNVTLNGAKVAGLVSSQVNNSGTKLLFRPTNGFIDGQRYRVTLSGALRDLHGKTLGGDYSFRFTASSHEQPVLAEIRPEFASWRGEVPITVYGANFSDATELFLAGQPVEASRIQRVSANELRFSLPALAQSPADNQVVGLQVRNGELVDSRHAAFTYIADPRIDKIGAYDRVTRVHDASRRNFLFNSGEVVAVEGRGFSPLTQVTINGKTASDVVLEGANLLSFRLPGNTLGQLHLVLSNVEPTVDGIANEDLRIELGTSTKLQGMQGLKREGVFLLGYETSGQKGTWNLMSTLESEVPLLLSKGGTDRPIRDTALSADYLALLLDAGRPVIDFYDLANPFEPRLLGRFDNPSAYPITRVQVLGDSWIGFGDNKLFVGAVRGPNVQALDLGPNTVQDLAFDQDGLFVLYDVRVDFRRAGQLDQVAQTLQ